eukprot:GILI01011213.1.p1 GENE.GILI01011213.1~~GILI01011213.1.p1  ORF type:complete len:657 (+),score=138.91 GILI01011213.1:439-2409(+)
MSQQPVGQQQQQAPASRNLNASPQLQSVQPPTAAASSPPPQSAGGPQPLATQHANGGSQDNILSRVCDVFKTAFGSDEAQCRNENRRYHLTRVIGHGATGVVINAKRVSDGASFAVKIVEVWNMSTADKDRAMAEVHSLITCDFFSVLKCHDDYVQYAVTNPADKSPSANTNTDSSEANNTDESSGNPANNAVATTTTTTNNKQPKHTIIASSSDPTPAPNSGLLNRDPVMLALVLDLANAGDLRQEIKNRAKRGKPFKEHEVGLLFIQILMAVHHVHQKHMIHRDIKTANVFLCSNGLVKLGDFGFSKQYSETVSTEVGRTFCGTPYYVAPEIWRRRPYSKKADMFSLGVLLYETLALKRPFEGATMTEVMEKTLQGQYDPLPATTSPEMQKIVKDLLSIDPARRPSSAQLLNYPLSKLFMDALVSIVQTQGNSTFDDAVRFDVNRNVAETRLSLKSPGSLAATVGQNLLSVLEASSSRSIAGMSTTGSTQVIVNNMLLEARHVYHEGMVHKLSGDGAWKRRYLCIFRTEATLSPHQEEGSGSESQFGNAAAAGGRQRQSSVQYEYKLLIAITKDTIKQQCIVAPFSEFEDVFPVPPRYAGSNAENVFSVVYRTGAKRLAFQAANALEQSLWMGKIQIALGLEDEEESSAVEIPL